MVTVPGGLMYKHVSCAIVIVVSSVNIPSAGAVVQEFHDRTDWENSVSGFTTIDFFDDFPLNTFITNEYVPLGIIFTDGNDRIDLGGPAYPIDGWGLWSSNGMHMDFDVPRTYLAVDHPGDMQIQLLRNGKMIYDSGRFVFGGGGAGFFSGVISSEPFDQAFLIDWFDGVTLFDDLHFGGAVPAPGMGALLGLAGLFGRTRQRKRQ